MIATLTIGIIIGARAGFTFACVLSVAKKADEEMQPPQEPTKLLTVGGLVRWKYDTMMNDGVYEIKRFHVDEGGQTVADIYIVNCNVGFTVPVEDLEAVEE